MTLWLNHKSFNCKNILNCSFIFLSPPIKIKPLIFSNVRPVASGWCERQQQFLPTDSCVVCGLHQQDEQILSVSTVNQLRRTAWICVCVYEIYTFVSCESYSNMMFPTLTHGNIHTHTHVQTHTHPQPQHGCLLRPSDALNHFLSHNTDSDM